MQPLYKQPMTLDEQKSTAENWFRTLRDSICAEFEAIEEAYIPTTPDLDTSLRSALREPRAAGARGSRPSSENIKFTRTPWARAEGGGGEIGLMKGRVFEKVGVNISTVHGEFSPQFRKEIPGAAENPSFWATGISLVAHMQSPLVPAAHFNTRMIVVGEGKRLWFGGGGDLNPMVPNAQDTADFHAAFKAACDQLDAVTRASRASEPSAREAARRMGQQTHTEQPNAPKGFYEAFSAWCDEYFYIPHRSEARGVGGIFYDYLGLNHLGDEKNPLEAGTFGGGGLGKEATRTGVTLAANAGLDWAESFAFTQYVGQAFQEVYSTLIRRHMHAPWTPEQRHHQLVRRGRYTEYNLLYDRGTRFGLMTGGNTEAILMSLPPMAVWE